MGRSPLLAVLTISALAVTAGCTRPGTARSLPLEVRTATSDQHAGAFAAALRADAYAGRFRPAREGEADKAVVMTVRSVREPIDVDGRPGFTYIVDWTRRGVELGGVEDDCAIGYLAPCANVAVGVLSRQLWGERRR
jgi:hypothetical protein